MCEAKQQIILVSGGSSQLNLFADYLSQSLGCRVTIQPPDAEAPPIANRQTILLLDADCMDVNAMQSWHPEQSTADFSSLAAFNVQDEEQAYTLATGLQLRGIFYRQSSLEMICKGIETLWAGHFWMSRPLMSRLVETYHRHHRSTYRPICGLTTRELQILGLLSAGANNHEIAQRLFISLHTVKSHLYNVFKKIEVRNRIEAVNWARQNLGTPPPAELVTGRHEISREFLS